MRIQEITIDPNGRIIQTSGSLISSNSILNKSAIDLFTTAAAISDLIKMAEQSMEDVTFHAVNGENLLGNGYFDFSFSFFDRQTSLRIVEKSSFYEQKRNLQQKQYDQMLREQNNY